MEEWRLSADGGKKLPLKGGHKLSLTVTAVGAVAVVAAAAFLSTSSSSPDQGYEFTGPRYPNADLLNTRHVSGPIRSATVSGLERAWTVPISTRDASLGSAASPVVSDGVAYFQDLDSNVQALALESGEVIWRREYGSPTVGPNGVLVADGHVYGATTTDAFALDRETGKEVWSVRLIRNDSEEINMAPGYHDGLVYFSTVPRGGSGGGVGILWALNGKTGKREWSFDTVPKGLWGNRRLNSGGGLSHPPAFDGDGGMYFGVGNPEPIPGTEKYPWGSSRPGPNLYTHSVVKLDAKTGKLRWHYQLKPHDICNGDMGPPVLVRAGDRSLVIASGNAGIVVALDRETGELVWKRLVGIHNGHDNDGLYAMRGEYSKLELPMTVYPGVLGGVFAPLSASRSTVFVPVVNYGTTLVSQTKARMVGSPTGELVALDLVDGEVQWRRKSSAAFAGAPIAVNDLVFAADSDGAMRAFGAEKGEVVWKAQMPAGFNAGLAVSDSMLIAPAGLVNRSGQTPKILAFRLPG